MGIYKKSSIELLMSKRKVPSEKLLKIKKKISKRVYTLDESPALKMAMKYFNSLPKEEQEKIKAEVYREVGFCFID